mgnify:CR=1 FL=1
MGYAQGDIVWIDWRYIDKIDKGESKPRPSLVISNNDCHEIDKGYMILCPITSNTRLNDFTFLIDNKSISRTLSKFSEVRTNKIFTYKSNLVLKKHGTIIDDDILSEIIQKVYNAIKVK